MSRTGSVQLYLQGASLLRWLLWAEMGGLDLEVSLCLLLMNVLASVGGSETGGNVKAHLLLHRETRRDCELATSGIIN